MHELVDLEWDQAACNTFLPRLAAKNARQLPLGIIYQVIRFLAHHNYLRCLLLWFNDALNGWLIDLLHRVVSS